MSKEEEALHAILKVVIAKCGAKGAIESEAKAQDKAGRTELANAIAQIFHKITSDNINPRNS